MTVRVPAAYNSVLTQQLPKKRYEHVIRVAETCEGLSLRYGADPEKARLAGWFHDVAKYLSPVELQERFGLSEDQLFQDVYNQFRPVWHAFVAPVVCQSLFPQDPGFDADVCQAMIWHTTGTDQMGLLDKILYVGDYTEPGRKGASVDLVRQYAESDIDEAVFALSSIVLYHLLQSNRSIHPESIACRNGALDLLSPIKSESISEAVRALPQFKDED